MDREHRPTDPVIPRHEVPQPAGQREHPLAHRDGRDDLVHQMRAVADAVRAPGRSRRPPWAPLAVTEDPLATALTGFEFARSALAHPRLGALPLRSPVAGRTGRRRDRRRRTLACTRWIHTSNTLHRRPAPLSGWRRAPTRCGGERASALLRDQSHPAAPRRRHPLASSDCREPWRG